MDKTEILGILRRLTAEDGLSGAEERVRALVHELAGPYAEQVRTDAMGSVIAYRRASHGLPDPPPGRIMLAAHLDEIGLIVTRVDRGFLHVGRVGGIDPRTLVGQEVTVYPTGPGADRWPDGILGYIGSRPPHLQSPGDQNKVIPLADLRVDLGVPGPGSAGSRHGLGPLASAVRVGDRVAIRGPFTELIGGKVATKALDNRASVAAMLGALGYLAQTRHTWDVYAVATSQEEVGLKGAMTSAFGVAPDVAVAIDVTFADTPGLNDNETGEWGSGPAISWGPNMHPAMVKSLRAAADALEIPYVNEPLPGGSGTDAWAMQVVREGIPSGLVSLPIRYMHSPVETVVVSDVDRAARLLAAFISRLDGSFLAGLPDEV
jgi:tetrahedral aminopeptidase